MAEDVHHLPAAAASAALHAGRVCGCRCRCTLDVAPLRTFGALKVHADEQVWIDTNSIDDLDPVHPLRRLTATDLTVPLEDTDPYRIGHRYAADRLSDAKAHRWQLAFAAGITDQPAGLLSGIGVRWGECLRSRACTFEWWSFR
ncbi:hypothetical protein AB0L63_18200 [Nocardia sp. NPDC051990]|uniref:hypothetical protein n=1 Tax=Nocardia sp. NPDC051990 TaxID=3155285 RepID=UPI00342EDB11